MANVTVDTTAPAYSVRRQQFTDIVNFWRPQIKVYFTLTKEQQKAWRTSDPFFGDVLRFTRAVEGKREEDL